MIPIDNILIDESIITTQFLCNTKKCKGACCTFKGGSGAPVLDSEVDIIHASVEKAWQYLPARAQQEITRHGAVAGESGNYSMQCIDDADCVFVYYDGDVAKCAIEKAHFAGESEFRKPLSCHLFPIRVADFHGPYLYYDVFSECRSALPHGKETGVYMYEMLRPALERGYGKEWTEKLDTVAERKRQDR
jgi:hypothetical protein